MRHGLLIVLLTTGLAAAQEPADDLPLATRDGYVFEVPGGRPGSFMTASDGDLLYYSRWKRYRSHDGGRTWSEPEEFMPPGRDPYESMRSVDRLASGRLGLLGVSDRKLDSGARVHGMSYWTHDEESGDWAGPFKVNAHDQPGVPYSGTGPKQLSSGRLVLPVRTLHFAHRAHRRERMAVARIAGKRIRITEHARYPEMMTTFCYLSDDEGETWTRSQGEVFIWKDEGRDGLWPFDEPVLAERDDGSVVMFGRTPLSRLYSSVSVDQGWRWTSPRPTELASSCSPCALAVIPGTGDLLCVWNQVSPEEIRGGFWRSRMSCAVSSDGGASFDRFKTVDAIFLEPTGRIEPPEPGLVHPRSDVGNLPGSYGFVKYPAIAFHGDDVLIRYRHYVYRTDVDRQLCAVVPTSWLYE